MIDIQIKIDEIRSLINNDVDHLEYSMIAKIPYKIHSFVEIMNLRMLDFCEASSLLIKNNYIIPSIALIRALFENIACIYRLSSAIDECLNMNKLTENIDELIMKISLGTRYSDEFAAINIMTNIEKLDKKYNGIKKYYEALCEFVHPNWDGVAGSYSELLEKDKSTQVFKVITVDHAVFRWVKSCFLLCMGIYIEYSKNIKNKLPSFANLCENEFIEGEDK